jgi:hypothetical protein
VEGLTDEHIVRKLFACVGLQPNPVYGRNGKDALRHKVSAYNKAARWCPWFVLVDLNGEAQCAPELLQKWLPQRATKLCFRVAVRETEAWLLADSEAAAHFLQVSRQRLPINPDNLRDPKDELLKLARQSRSRDLREGMIPSQQSGRRVGPLYATYLIEYIANHWDPVRASSRSDSLKRTMRALQSLRTTASSTITLG